MHAVLKRILSIEPHKQHRLNLALISVLGLVLGTVTVILFGDVYISLIRAAACCRVSIIGLVSVAYLPLAAAILSVIFTQPFLFLFVFCKSFSYSIVSLSIYSAFNMFGWVAQILLLFTDCFSYTLLFWFLCRNYNHSRSLMRDALVYIIVMLPVVATDYCLISPLLDSLFNY